MLTPGFVSLGRDEANDLVITEGDVSDFHAEVVAENDRVFVTDLLSSSGTFVNDQRVGSRQEIVAWDVIRIGNTELELNDPKIGRPDAWAVLIDSPSEPPQRVVLQPRTLIGRDRGCDISLQGDLLSRRHAELQISGSHLTVMDLSSVNGTFLNGRRVERASVYPDDELTIGGYRLTVQGPRSDSSDHEDDRTQVKTSELEGHSGRSRSMETTELDDDTELLTDPHDPYAPAFLTQQGGPGEDSRVKLDGTSLSIGRHPDNGLQIENGSVSKFHAVIRRNKGNWEIEDCGSSNGTFINEKRCTHQTLRDGDRITLGRVYLEFTTRLP